MTARISETYIAASTAQKTKQYDMYKRFIRWASDRLADDGIIAFVSNSAFLDAKQDDGFRKIVADEFNELWVVDLKGNARTSGERRRQEGGNIFDDKIRVGVAVYFLVREKGKTGFKVFYNAVDDYAKSHEKVEYIRDKVLVSFDFSEITPDTNGQWLNQSNSDFANLMPLANRETKLGKTSVEEQAVFALYSLGIVTARDEWSFDTDADVLAEKANYFCYKYESERRRFNSEAPDTNSVGDWVDRSIKWTSELEAHLVKGDPLAFNSDNLTSALFRPFVTRHCYYAPIFTHRRYQQPHIFPNARKEENRAICFCVNGKNFYVLATNRLVDYHFTGDTQCLPFYRYTPDGQRVSNVTDWGLRQFREHYGDDSITAEDIFAYTYAMLHDPAYQQRYEVDLLREFPRLHFQDDFAWWAQQGQALLDLHLGFESAEPYPLERVEQPGPPGKAMLRADKERNVIVLDSKTTLAGVPWQAWLYRLGSRSAVEWVLDQYKERKPRDPTIAEKFNTYRFADHKEQVIDLLARVCTVSVATMKIVDYELDVQTNIDPDEGLEFKEEFVQEMERRMNAVAAGEPTIPWEEVKRRHGWD